MPGQWDGVVNNIRAFGELGRISNIIDQAGQGILTCATNGGAQAVQDTSKACQPARNQAVALTDMMNGAKTSYGKLQHMIKRLREAAGINQINSSRALDDLKNNTTIKRVRAKIATLQKDFQGHADQLQ